MKTVSCPTCQRPVEWSPDSPFRPFCSERCRLIDLGAWASEQRVIPGGTCEFDLPDYTHWLNQPDEIRGADFAHWLAVIRPLGDAVSELLWMTREQGKSRPEVAPGGVFHLTLDRDVPAQMIRIALPSGTDIYPEISGSHYRCSVRFLVWQDASTRPIQTTEDVRFTLTTCT